MYRFTGEFISICLANSQENKVEIEIFDKFGVAVGKCNTKDLVVKRKLELLNVPTGAYVVKIKIKTSMLSKSSYVG